MSYDNLKNILVGQGEKRSLNPFRSLALSKIKELTLPTRKSEDWRFIPLSSHDDWNFDFSSQVPAMVKNDLIDDLKNKLQTDFVLSFVNGHYSKAHSHLPKGLSLRESIEDEIEMNSFFEFTNALFSEENLTLTLDEKTEIERPLLVNYISTEEGTKLGHTPRLKIKLGKFSKLNLVEAYYSQGEFHFFSNPCASYELDVGSKLCFTSIHNESSQSIHIGTSTFNLKKDAALDVFNLMTGNKLERHHYKVNLCEQGANTKLRGVYSLTDSQTSDLFLTINHFVNNTQSEQLFRSVLADDAHGVFTGKIFIHKDAQQTDAAQLCNTLLVGPKAKMNTQPQLEIYADDVKCTHGATIGQLDQDQIFYLESRGIKRERAQRMITSAFVSQILDSMSDAPTKMLASKIIEEKLQRISL